MSTTTNLHDKLVRQAFSKRKIAQPFFERYLPPEVVAALDLSTLAAAQETFVEPDLRAQHSDVLFRVQTKAGRPALAYLLIEHESYPDPWAGLQLLGYVVRIWERERAGLSTPPLPPIVPLLLYHDGAAWNRGTTFSDWVDAPGPFQVYVPDFAFALCDLSHDQLDQLQHWAWLAVLLQVLKYSRSDELPGRLPENLMIISAAAHPARDRR